MLCFFLPPLPFDLKLYCLLKYLYRNNEIENRLDFGFDAFEFLHQYHVFNAQEH